MGEMSWPDLSVSDVDATCCGALTRGSNAAADATSPIDYTQRNKPYAPADSVEPEKRKPAGNAAVQDKRVEKTTVEKQKSSLQDREAAVDVKESRPKQVREKEEYPTRVIEHTTSDFNHQTSRFSTASDTSKPPTVAKYQDSLSAANAITVKRTSALGARVGILRGASLRSASRRSTSLRPAQAPAPRPSPLLRPRALGLHPPYSRRSGS